LQLEKRIYFPAHVCDLVKKNKMKTKKLFTTFAIGFALVVAGCDTYEPTPTTNQVEKKTASADRNSESARMATLSLAGASGFAVLAATTITNDGASLINGDIGVSPGTAITGFQPEPINSIVGPGTVTAGLGVVNGTIYAADPTAAQAHNDAVIIYNSLVAQVPDNIYSGVTQLNGMTFTPGVYSFAPSANLQVNGTVYLDFQGDNDAAFIFQLGTTLVTMTGSKVIALNNNNVDCMGSNVYWTVGSSATIDGAEFIGNVIANTTITMTAGSNVSGRIWALNGAVTMVSDTISACSSNSVPNEPKVCRDFVTGGGAIKINGKEKATFGVSGGIKNGKFWGSLSYHDHGRNGLKVKSTKVTSYIFIDAVTRQIEGVANVNGRGNFTYKVTVADNGEPGRNDTFKLELSNGYSASGVMQNGNIQLHTKCGASDNDDQEHFEDKDEKEGHKN
jgi:hypothetical protein